LQSHPELCGCVVSCVDCGIRFLTHPRNAGRRELRCPFGCREHHRRKRSCQRSTAYYRTAAGKRKKKRLNARRQSRQVPPAAPPQPGDDPQATSPHPQAGLRQTEHCRPGLRLGARAAPALEVNEPFPAGAELQREGVVLDEASVAGSPMLPHVRMVVSLIEGVEFTCREVVELLRRTLRQHSIGAGRRVDYLLDFLHRYPP
jgi:hypothetical protein